MRVCSTDYTFKVGTEHPAIFNRLEYRPDHDFVIHCVPSDYCCLFTERNSLTSGTVEMDMLSDKSACVECASLNG